MAYEWANGPMSLTFARDPKSPIHHDASPVITLQVLCNLVGEMLRNKVDFVTVDDLQEAIEHYKQAARQ